MIDEITCRRIQRASELLLVQDFDPSYISAYRDYFESRCVVYEKIVKEQYDGIDPHSENGILKNLNNYRKSIIENYSRKRKVENGTSN